MSSNVEFIDKRETVDKLTKWLELAKNDDIDSILVIGFHGEKESNLEGYDWDLKITDFPRLIGFMELIKVEMSSRYMSYRDSI